MKLRKVYLRSSKSQWSGWVYFRSTEREIKQVFPDAAVREVEVFFDPDAFLAATGRTVADTYAEVPCGACGQVGDERHSFFCEA